jgi:hypothetical protein
LRIGLGRRRSRGDGHEAQCETGEDEMTSHSGKATGAAMLARGPYRASSRSPANRAT